MMLGMTAAPATGWKKVHSETTGAAAAVIDILNLPACDDYEIRVGLPANALSADDEIYLRLATDAAVDTGLNYGKYNAANVDHFEFTRAAKALLSTGGFVGYLNLFSAKSTAFSTTIQLASAYDHTGGVMMTWSQTSAKMMNLARHNGFRLYTLGGATIAAGAEFEIWGRNA